MPICCGPAEADDLPWISVLESEIILGMRLLGAKSISDLKPEMLECIQEGWGLS